MLRLSVSSPAALTPALLAALEQEAYVTGLAVFRGASVRPAGDVLVADVPREVADELIWKLLDLGVAQEGSISAQPVPTWVSRPAFEAELEAPGNGADSVVWPEVAARAYDDSQLNWTFLSFLTLATVLAAIAIIVDSQILTIGAMILGPEFGAIAALGLALVRGRFGLLRMASRTLVVGFVVAIGLTTLASLVGRAIGWIDLVDVVGPRPGTAFIYHPDKWTFLIAVIAAAAGVLSLTSAKASGLSGVFVSVTTVPAAGNVGLGLAFGAWDEVRGSAWQLVLNIIAMALAGWATLAFQQLVWTRVRIRRQHADGRRPLV